MPTTHPDHHLLAPDVDAIDAFAAMPRHDVPAEGRAAAAIYEDVCWRLAFFKLPPDEETAIAAIEEEAASMLRRYLGGDLPAAEFWAAFGSLVEALDARVDGLMDRHDLGQHHQELARLRARVAATPLPPTIRREVRLVLETMADAENLFAVGALAAPAYAAAFKQAAQAIEATLLAAEPLPESKAAAHARHEAERVLAAAPPPFLRRALRARLQVLTEDWLAQRPVADGALAALEDLLERAAEFGEVHQAATARLAALEAAMLKAPLAPEHLATAGQALAGLLAQVGQLEDGRLEADDFQLRFDHDAAQLARLLGAPDEARP